MFSRGWLNTPIEWKYERVEGTFFLECRCNIVQRFYNHANDMHFPVFNGNTVRSFCCSMPLRCTRWPKTFLRTFCFNLFADLRSNIRRFTACIKSIFVKILQIPLNLKRKDYPQRVTFNKPVQCLIWLQWINIRFTPYIVCEDE